MYIKLKIDDVLLKKGILDHYKLCYICPIPETICDYTPETKFFKHTGAFKILERKNKEKMAKSLKETGHYTVDLSDPYYTCQKMQDYPNPEYVPGETTLFAYFTSKDLDKQWGDDWDDIPYDCNAERPYDGDEEIIIIPFYIEDGCLPVNWSSGVNCLYSVRDINRGAVAWIYNRERNICIHAGVNPYEFVKKLRLEETT